MTAQWGPGAAAEEESGTQKDVKQQSFVPSVQGDTPFAKILEGPGQKLARREVADAHPYQFK